MTKKKGGFGNRKYLYNWCEKAYWRFCVGKKEKEDK